MKAVGGFARSAAVGEGYGSAPGLKNGVRPMDGDPPAAPRFVSVPVLSISGRAGASHFTFGAKRYRARRPAPANTPEAQRESPEPSESAAARPASSRATGIRNGEQDT
ncbi:hypothetical protein GCM10011583_33250 [Streptomyces camponoticapitis]|uniref:Uncharacterized protein n=1 Tax=Streptomyces camponoticapitis TaxID=1616125 RepID=A0ABQ2E799_9ACTN|nr:hypothetical protein GCM10011583_33250 [Streptomyces camponoticapitis]